MGEFRMPSLGADMDVGTIVEWLVEPGDAVKRGQIVAVVDTAKAAIEIEAFESGVIEEILVGIGVQVPVGTPLAIIGAPSEVSPAAPGVGVPAPAAAPPGQPVAEPSAPPSPEQPDGAPPVPPQPASTPAPAAAPGPAPAPPPVRLPRRRTRPAAKPTTPPPFRAPVPEHPRAAPPVRHLAHQLGVDLDAVSGTGPDGHVTHDDVVNAAAPVAVAGLPASAGTPPGPPPVPISTLGATSGRLRVTPRARRIAAERGVDLASAAATEGAAITGTDVERAAERAGAERVADQAAAGKPAAAGPDAAALPPSGPPSARPAAAAHPDRKAAMRTAIATLMSRSNAEIPHYYVTQTMDLAPGLTWLRGHNADRPPAQRLLPAVLFLRATVLAASAVPDLNGHWLDGALRPADRVDLGVAVATRGGGLVTPAIPDAGPLGVDDLMARLADLVGRARRGNLKQSEMAGASITVSSLGESGPDALYGVIFPPQVALVGIGGIVERPWAVDGMLTVRPTSTVVLAADHRASDGRTASAFLAAFAHALAHPEEL